MNITGTKARILKIIGVISGILAVIWAILFWGPWLAAWWTMNVVPPIDSLGIIGGADGPTVVAVTTAVVLTGNIWGQIFYWVEMAMPLILAAVSATCFIWRKKILKKGE